MSEEENLPQAKLTERQSNRRFFTPGPPSLSQNNLAGLATCFGRGDGEYGSVEERVLGEIKKMSGQSRIVRLQGSASLALEIVSLNFLRGDVLIVETGYYSRRLEYLAKDAQRANGDISSVRTVLWNDLSGFTQKVDWVWACPVETSIGLKLDIRELRGLASKLGAALALDATASIGLESNHGLADVTSFSSCKGLFGLAGAAFISYSRDPENEVHSFNLSLDSHRLKLMTGPYHAIQSLDFVLADYESMRDAVKINKSRFLEMMKEHLVFPAKNQPLLCTKVTGVIRSKSGRSVLYEPRGDGAGSVVCHLGEVDLGSMATGASLEDLEIVF